MANINCNTPAASPEEWRQIVNYEGRYEVSNHGRIRSFVSRPNCSEPRIIRPRQRRNGYLQIGLKNNGQKYHLVHRLVAVAFLGEPAQGMEVNHRNGDKTNNHVNNLEYVTHRQNQAHAGRLGLMTGGKPTPAHRQRERLRGKNMGNNTLTESDVHEIRRMLAAGCLQKDIGRRFGVGREAISSIKRRKSWVHLETPELVLHSS